MKQKSLVNVRSNQADASYLAGFMILAVSLTLLLMSATAESGAGGAGPVSKSDAVKFEAIPGSSIKRVILTAKAAERLGIETAKVHEQRINRRQMVGGRIIRHDQVQQPKKKDRGKFAGLGKFAVVSSQSDIRVQEDSESQQETGTVSVSDATDEEWLEVTLSEGEYSRLQKDKPVRILKLFTRDKLESEVLALPSGMEPYEDRKRSMLKVYYRLPDKGHGLTLYHRVRVELPLVGSADKRLVVPYSAAYYDAKGDSWVYVNPRSLVYERQRIQIERIEGDLAVLSDSLSVGTLVVTVGASLLYGAEVVFGK